MGGVGPEDGESVGRGGVRQVTSAYPRMPLVRSMSVRIRRLLFVMALISPGVLFAPAALAAQPAAATANAIRAINVDGNRRVEPETVRSYLQFAPGDAYDPGKVDGSIKALFA